MSSQSGPQYAGQSPNYLTKEERRKNWHKEVQGPPKYLLDSYITLRCPDCFCMLKARRPSEQLVWICHCKHHHCWQVSLEKGQDRPILEKIPSNDPRYYKRMIKQ